MDIYFERYTAGAQSTKPPGMWTTVVLRSALRPKSHGLTMATLPDSTTHRSKSGSGSLNVPTTAVETGRYKTINDLAGPSLATTAYWLFVKGYANKSHAMQVIRQEDRYPAHTDLPHWKEYRDPRGQAYGLHVYKGSEWHRIRSVLNPRMLKLKEVSAYALVMHQVVGDLLLRPVRLRLRSPDRATVSDLAGELYKFGFEDISAILFETRLGCPRDEIPGDALRFITAVNNMLTLSETVLFLPCWTRRILPFWTQFVRAWDTLYDVARNLIDRRAQEINDRVKRVEEVEGMYLTYLLSSDRLSLGEVYTSITELLLGGGDTTSNTLSWTLYHLARDKSVQDRLYQEVCSVCPGTQLPSREDLARMPYLKAVIKETLSTTRYGRIALLLPPLEAKARTLLVPAAPIDLCFFPRS